MVVFTSRTPKKQVHKTIFMGRCRQTQDRALTAQVRRPSRPAPEHATICARPALHQKYALAAGALVEQPIGFGGPIERPAIGVDPVDIDAALGDEFRAVGLAYRRESP